MTHTPGPWVVDNSHTRTAINTPDYGTAEGVGKHIAMVNWSPRWISLEEHEANAYLIAAAPEMFDACERTENVLSAILWFDYSNDTPIFTPPQRETLQEVRDQLHAIIAKAKGAE